MEKLNKELSSLLADCDNIDIAEVLSEIKMKKKLSEIQKQYKDKIKIRGDDCRLYVRIKDKQFFGNTAEEVFEKIYQHQYGLTTYSIYELFPLYLDYREQYTAVKSLTLKKYVNDFDKYFKPYKEILDKPFTLLGVKDYIRFFNRWTAKLDMTAKTFNNLKSIINGMYSFTITELDFDITNKVRDIDMRQFQVKPVKHVDKAFTFEEREMILKYLSDKSDAYSLALAFNFYCGMRIGELLALRHSDVTDGKISINGQLIKDVDIKTNKVNYVTSDIIKGYTAIIDESAVDPNSVTALIELKVTPLSQSGYDEIAQEIAEYEEVESVRLMSGAYDIIVSVTGSNIREISQFVSARLAAIDAVTSTTTHFQLKAYKENSVMIHADESDERGMISP